MKFIRLFLLAVLCTRALSSLADSEISLAPWFGDGMVMQRSGSTILQGKGPPGTSLLIQFKSQSRAVGRPQQVQVNNSGDWKVELDLTTAEFQRAGVSWTLWIAEEKNRKKRKREYSDILIGDVIIVAGWEGQGVPAEAKDFDARTSQFRSDGKNVRFLDLRTNLPGSAPSSGAPSWVAWPNETPHFKRYSTLTLRLAHMLAAKNYPEISTTGCVGVVLATPEILLPGVDPGRVQTARQLPAQDSNWSWVTEDARKAQELRGQRLISNKRHNIVANVAPVIDYAPALRCLQECFYPEKPPLLWFSFAGAFCSSTERKASH